jgi:outer membrane biosynthesis protein TonB
MSMSSPSLPPKVPTKSLTAVWVALAGLIAALVIGGVLWKVSSKPAPEQTAEPKPEAHAAEVKPAPAPVAPEPPPPPPPEEAPPPPPAASAAPAPSKPLLFDPRAPLRAPTAKRDPNCDSPCNGRETPELTSALGAKARQARSCYERALSNNTALTGKIEVGVRVSPMGTACSAVAGKDTLGDSAVSNCVLSRFRSGKYPKPTGGCVDLYVPINFKPAGAP